MQYSCNNKGAVTQGELRLNTHLEMFNMYQSGDYIMVYAYFLPWYTIHVGLLYVID